MRKLIAYLYRKFCTQNILEILQKDLNLADFEIKTSHMSKDEKAEYLASSYRIVKETSFAENIEKMINAQANLTFTGGSDVKSSTLVITALRSLQEVFETQARQFDNLTTKKPQQDPYEIG